ncbi:GtrA family protein [Parolsenella sp. LCP21S3_E11]|uniref:GtrA family protein n=1 Tax=Parolsenella sp. LCP21S3_E11 TaxID=3438797 RepID=UPI003F95B019
MKGLIEQFLKFGVVGAIAFLIDYGVLMLLSQVIGMDPVISASISFVVSVVFNYVASMHYVFTRRDDISRRREFTIFVVLSAIGLVINEIIMVIGVNVLGDSALMVTITKLVATAIVMVWNFVSRKKWLDAGDSAE